jgi:signal transduction histidine kinase
MFRVHTCLGYRRFVRIKTEKTRKIMGSGLGLAILKKLALLNGGDVKVESALDVGTRFTVTLAQRQKSDKH